MKACPCDIPPEHRGICSAGTCDACALDKESRANNYVVEVPALLNGCFGCGSSYIKRLLTKHPVTHTTPDGEQVSGLIDEYFHHCPTCGGDYGHYQDVMANASAWRLFKYRTDLDAAVRKAAIDKAKEAFASYSQFTTDEKPNTIIPSEPKLFSLNQPEIDMKS